MDIKLEIEKDLKSALLSGNKTEVSILKGVKAAILDAEIEKNCRDDGLPEADLVALLQKEAKKRRDTADIYEKAGDNQRRDNELAEVKVIEGYLPTQMSEDQINKIIDEVTGGESISMESFGQIIKAVREKTGGSADGGTIAGLVKKRVQG